jgi:hypothetical protein
LPCKILPFPSHFNEYNEIDYNPDLLEKSETIFFTSADKVMKLDNKMYLCTVDFLEAYPILLPRWETYTQEVAIAKQYEIQTKEEANNVDL